MTAPGTLLLDTTMDIRDGLVVFNQTDADGVEWFGDLTEGWYETVGDRLSMQDKSAAAGSYDGRSYGMARTMVLEGAVSAPTRDLADRSLSRFAGLWAGGLLVPMVVSEPAGSFRLMVRKATKPSVKRINATQWTYQLSVVAPDGLKYAADLSTLSTGLVSDAPGGVQWGGPAGTTGVQWGGAGVVWQSGNGASGTVTLSNPGTADTPIRFVVSGLAPGPSIVDVTRDNTITFPDNVALGSQLVIDTGTRYVALDGANRRPQLTAAGFFSIPAESSIEVAFRAPTPSLSALLSAAWRPAWL